jgi:hypothetical protein
MIDKITVKYKFTDDEISYIVETSGLPELAGNDKKLYIEQLKEYNSFVNTRCKELLCVVVDRVEGFDRNVNIEDDKNGK